MLAFAVHALLLVMLLLLAPRFDPFRKMPSQPITVELLPETRTAATRAETVARSSEASGGAASKLPTPMVKPPVAKPPLPPLVPPIDLIPLTRQELASVDLAMNNRAQRGAEGVGKAGDRTGEADGPDDGAGEGPGGERLHTAQWYRKPTDAELSPYLPAGARPSGWGMVACQMVDDYRVENCREIGQSPLGSGLARAVRLAAWQFRALPPRLGGRVIKGAWVRIRIEYSQGVPK